MRHLAERMAARLHPFAPSGRHTWLRFFLFAATVIASGAVAVSAPTSVTSATVTTATALTASATAAKTTTFATVATPATAVAATSGALGPVAGASYATLGSAVARAGEDGSVSWSPEFDIQGVDGTVRSVLSVTGGVWIGGEFAVAGDRRADNAVFFTGSEWVDAGSFDDRVAALALHEGRVVAGGRFTSVNGTAAARVAIFDESMGWQPLGDGFENRDDPSRCEVHALLSFGGRLYAGGEFTHADGSEAMALAVWDGERWAPVSGGSLSGDFLSVHVLTEFQGALAVGGEFDQAGDVVTSSIALWREGAWGAFGDGLGGIVRALHTRGDTLFAGGFFRLRDRDVPLENFAVWTGDNWESWGAFDGIDPTVLAIDEFQGAIIVAGEFQFVDGARFEQIARWDGSAWQRMSGGFVGTGGVHDLEHWGNFLVAGGAFSNASGHSGWGLARWGGSAWNPIGVGHGMSGPVYALALDDGQILAGGRFARAGRVAGENISLWNGSGWVPLGANLDREVLALAVRGDQYFAAGLFFRYSGGLSRYVLYRDGGSWESPRGGVAAATRCLTVFGDEVVVGGLFARAGGRPAERIASWNGEIWNPLGAGLSDAPNAFLVREDGLIAGGRFLAAGNVDAPRLARWDGQNWFPFPSGPDGEVLALADHGGALIVGGAFEHVGDVPAGGIAAWDGVGWSALGSGFDGPVHAIASTGSRLVVGGAFSRADGKPASGIAYWDGWSWNPLDEGVAGGMASVEALVSAGDRLVLGGDFNFAGGLVSYNFAIRSGPIPLQVWPGDCDNNGRVDGFDLLALGRHWNLTGPSRSRPGGDWAPAAAEDWDLVSGTYADADGSGRVDLEDVPVLLANWGRDRSEGKFTDLAGLPDGVGWLQLFDDAELIRMHERLQEGGPIASELRSRIEEALGWGEGADGEMPPPFDASLVGTPSVGWPEVRLRIPGRMTVRLELVDVAGRRLSAADLDLNEGDHRLEVPRPERDPGSGVFFVRLRAGGPSGFAGRFQTELRVVRLAR